MCYDISFTVKMKELADYFPDLIFDEQILMNFEPVHIMGHTYAEHPIIFREKQDQRLHLKLMEWGCIPYYVKDEKTFMKQRATMLNARAERILGDNKSYWNKIRNRRCLVPVSGFYEHREIPAFKKKVPYFISLKKQPTFFLPGLYSVAELPDKETGELIKRFTYTIITRSANSLMEQIHNGGDNAGRMPLILPLQLSKKWLDEDLSEDQYNAVLDEKILPDEMNYRTVFTIRSPKDRPDGKEKNEEYMWEKLPEILL